jgi:hypothetical protein
MHATETAKLISIAAKILERRNPRRTRTESEAQPIAERMAVISATSDMGADRMRRVQISPRPGDLQPQLIVYAACVT